MLLIRVVGSMTQTFEEPQVMMVVAFLAIQTYLFGCFFLWKTSYRREFYFYFIKMALLYVMYAKAYPLVHLILPTVTLTVCITNKACWFLINLSF